MRFTASLGQITKLLLINFGHLHPGNTTVVRLEWMNSNSVDGNTWLKHALTPNFFLITSLVKLYVDLLVPIVASSGLAGILHLGSGSH